jgi:hypothetical protein
LRIVPGPLRDIDLMDVPAMAMHLLGEEIPRRYMQNLPRRLFPLSYFVHRPMRYAGGPSEGLRRPGERPGSASPGGDSIEEQLRSIGYVGSSR